MQIRRFATAFAAIFSLMMLPTIVEALVRPLLSKMDGMTCFCECFIYPTRYVCFCMCWS